jgi:general secretion pathway protein F
VEYRYVAVDSQGQTVTGQLEAGGEREAARALRSRDLTPLEIAASTVMPTARGGSVKKASEQEKALIIRELATLLNAGVSLAEAVDSIGQSHAQSAAGQAFIHAHGRLRGGENFSAALASAGLSWPDYLFQLIAAGEHTGKLAQGLESAAAQMEYEQRVRSEMRGALIYPAILVTSGIAATLLIFVVVVPKFAGLLKSTRAQIPEVSVWVLSTGLFVKEHLLWLGLGAALLVAAAARALYNADTRAALLQRVATLPLVGEWLRETEVGRWAAMLGTLLENRVPILKAMELAQEGMRLGAMRTKLQQVLKEVRGGRKLADACQGAGLLDVTGLNLVRVGERSGELAAMLRALATLHENAGRERLKRFLLLLEPAAILVIGGVIGFVMISVMLAITSLSNVPI